jgi:hypothetical protein
MRDAKNVERAIQRGTAKRHVALVLQVVKGEIPVVEAARQHGLKVAEVEDRDEKLLLGAENALRSRPKDGEAGREQKSND